MGSHSQNFNRRTLVAGAAWAVPTAAVAVSAPALAASQPALTETAAVTPQLWFNFENADKGTDCNPTTNPGGGYVNTFCCLRQSGYPADGNCTQDPNTSIGVWLETAGATSATARVDSAKLVLTFPSAIVIDTVPMASYSTVIGKTNWTGSTMWNGWSYSLASDGRTLTLTYSTPTVLKTSTAAASTGTCLPGFFFNYHYTTACSTAKPTATKSVAYTTAKGSSVRNW